MIEPPHWARRVRRAHSATGRVAMLALCIGLHGACAIEPAPASSPGLPSSKGEAVDRMTELARTTLQAAPADTAVVRLSVRPAPDAVASGAVLLATLVTGPAPGRRQLLGRFSLYPADQPGIFLLRLDAVARRALRDRSEPPQVVLSAKVPLVSASAPASTSAVSAWQVSAEWLPEPRSR